jgi:manganese transport protein
LAPILFAVALIAAGQSSTITGTLAGQIVMEGYLNIRLQPWLRRLITRLIAIVPAFVTVYLFGEEKTGELLLLSQVILSLQLGFAVIPLIHFTSDKKSMGEFGIKPWVQLFAWLSAGIIVSLNVKLVIENIMEWLSTSANPALIYFFVIPLIAAAGILLLYVTFAPLFTKIGRRAKVPHGEALELAIPALSTLHTESRYKKVAITVDFSSADLKAIREALMQGGKNAEYVFIHIVETAGALMMSQEIDDFETLRDREELNRYAKQIRDMGLKASVRLGYGDPKVAIPQIVKETNVDLLVMGSHGHGILGDIAFGTTLESVRHQVRVPVVIV